MLVMCVQIQDDKSVNKSSTHLIISAMLRDVNVADGSSVVVRALFESHLSALCE